MHHFPFHITDIDHATARLTLEEFGGLVRLWMACLKSEKPLPNALTDLQFLTGARTKNETRSLQQVVKRFFSDSTESPTLQSGFCEAIISDYRASGVQSRYANLCRHWDKANKGTPKPTFEQFAVNPDSWFESDTGRVRKLTGRNSLVLVSEHGDAPNPLPSGSQPITNNQEPITIGSPVVPKGTVTTGLPDFDKLAEAVYALYPKKVGKGAGIKAIIKVLKSGKITELELQGHVRAYAEAVAKWDKQDSAYIPNPSTWFNQERYLDDPATWVREPADAAKKRKGGGGPPEAPDTLFAMGTTTAQGAPAGWKTAMAALFGAKWQAHYPAFQTMPPADQRQVHAWLGKNGPGAFECPAPCDWHTVWMDVFGARECPDTWAEVCGADRQALVSHIEKKKGGVGES